MDINCDMGEGTGNEALLMPFIHSANIACGYHAGDEETIKHTISLCLQHHVNIGAHPSFLDRRNFGRTNMYLPAKEIYTLVTDQLKLFVKIANELNAFVHHVKPHGALYNMAATDQVISRAIADAVKDYDASLILYGLSGSCLISEAETTGLKTMNEVFADRTYQDDGTLTPRNTPNALLTNSNDVKKQLQHFKKNKAITVNNKEIAVKADTVCIHGDGEHAVDFAKAVYQQLNEA